jgi:hypothetical protein
MNRAAEAERCLLDVGISATVESAGRENEVAVIRYRNPKDGGETLGEEMRRISVACCTAAGFRYVALELY